MVSAALVGAVVLAVLVGGVAVFRARTGGAPSADRTGRRVLLIGLDGGDWDILDPLLAQGELPNLSRLIKGGAHARLRSAQPMLSPVLWTTVATGVRPERHGILDFIAIATATGEAIPVTSTLRREPAFWNRLSASGIAVGVTGWWATWPAERVDGFLVSDRIAPQIPGSVEEVPAEGKTWPPELWHDVLTETITPESLLPDDLRGYFGPAPGDRPEEMRSVEAEIRRIVASQRTYERISERLSRRFAPQVEAVYIQETDTIAHLTMPWRPPALPGTEPLFAARFGGAVDQSYREADRIIGEAVARAGPGADVIVASDHGFRSGADRPRTSASRIGRGRASDWHRPWGILILSGPSIRPGAAIENPGLLDIAPTLLALAGAPVAAAFEGRILEEALTDEARARIRKEPAPARPASAGAPAATGRAPSGPASLDGAAPSDASGDPAERQALLERLVSLGYLSPDSLNARNNRGILALNRGDFTGAIGEFRAALEENADQPPVLVNLARALWLAGDTDEARNTVRAALDLEPGCRQGLNLAGNIEMAAGHLDLAERQFREALALEPDDADLNNSLGLVLESQARWEEALAAYTRVVEIDPDYAGGYNNIGNICRRLGRDAEAEQWYRRAMEADPDFAGSWNNLALLLQERGDLAGAEPLYRKALALTPRDARTHNNLASLFFARGQMKEALAAFEEAARLDPSYAEPVNGMGAVYGRLGRHPEEKAAYREALRIRPDYLDARYNLALALLREAGPGGQGSEAAEAESHLRAVLAAEPGYREASDALRQLQQARAGAGNASGPLRPSRSGR